jgi:hypothetical protein
MWDFSISGFNLGQNASLCEFEIFSIEIKNK